MCSPPVSPRSPGRGLNLKLLRHHFFVLLQNVLCPWDGFILSQSKPASCYCIKQLLWVFGFVFLLWTTPVYKQVWLHSETGGWTYSRGTQSKGIRQHHPHNTTGVERVPPSKGMGSVETAGKQCVLISYQDKACVVWMRISPQSLCTEYSVLSW